MPAFFITAADRVGDCITLTGDLHHHLSHSLRVKAGETVTLTEAGLCRHLARVQRVDRSTLVAQIERTEPAPPAGASAVHLALAILKHDPMDWVVQKATELGVAAIHPLLTTRSAVRPDAARAVSQRNRWERIALEAAQQSERWTIPMVHEPLTLDRWLAARRSDSVSSEGAISLVLQERGASHTLVGMAWPDPVRSVTVAIGPEGGWAPEELLRWQEFGAAGVSMGSGILRAETAALTAITLVQNRLGLFG